MSTLSDDDLLERYESLYTRDFAGRLIRVEEATLRELEQRVTVRIDGRTVEVPLAVPSTDDQGVIRTDADGRMVPRKTTIYDAAAQLFTPEPEPDRPVPRSDNPIPVLCHQDHLRSVAVCRVCSVLLSRRGRAGTRLVPACQHPVVDGMEVHTVRSQEKVTFPDGESRPAGPEVCKAVKALVGLLASCHLHFDQPENDRRYHNELLALADEFGVLDSSKPRAADSDGRLRVTTPFVRKPYAAGERSGTNLGDHLDRSSPIILVDHNNCVRCDRCVRACTDVKPFRIIGHTGYGHGARIAFDLDRPMGESACFACGECAVACPTGALQFKGTIYQDRDPWQDQAPRPATVTAADLGRVFAWCEGSSRTELPAPFRRLSATGSPARSSTAATANALSPPTWARGGSSPPWTRGRSRRASSSSAGGRASVTCASIRAS